MKLKKIEKFAIILTGLLFLTLTLYFLLCPVRTVGEVLAKGNLDSPDKIRINPTAPKSWSACDLLPIWNLVKEYGFQNPRK